MKSFLRLKLFGCAFLLTVQCGCVSKSFSFARTELTAKALEGDSAEIRELSSKCWRDGNRGLACQWLRRAAIAGDAMACELLGWCALTGDGLNQSNEDAAVYFYLAGCLYWDRWLMAFGFKDNEPQLTMFLCRQGSPVCDAWRNVEDRIMMMANFNRAMLLGIEAAQRKKEVIDLQLSKMGVNNFLPSYKILNDEMAATDIRDFVGNENIRAAFPGEHEPALSITADIIQAPFTNAELLVSMAGNIANMPSRFSELIALPRPKSVSFVGLNEGFNSAREHGRAWSYVIVNYTENQEAQANRAYRQLAALEKREHTIVQMAKAIPLYYDTHGKEATIALLRDIVAAAGLTESEQDILQCCMSKRDWRGEL